MDELNNPIINEGLNLSKQTQTISVDDIEDLVEDLTKHFKPRNFSYESVEYNNTPGDQKISVTINSIEFKDVRNVFELMIDWLESSKYTIYYSIIKVIIPRNGGMSSTKVIFDGEIKITNSTDLTDVRNEIIKQMEKSALGKINEGLNLPKLNLNTPEKWFKNLLSQMDQVTTDLYVYFKLNNENYMRYNKENRVLLYSYDKIYLVLKEKFELSYQQMNELIKGIVEANTNLVYVTPFYLFPLI